MKNEVKIPHSVIILFFGLSIAQELIDVKQTARGGHFIDTKAEAKELSSPTCYKMEPFSEMGLDDRILKVSCSLFLSI